MTAQPADLYETLRKIRYDTTAIQAKVTDAFAILDALNIPDQAAVTCPKCTLELTGPRALAEHDYNLHDGPEPPHYADPPKPPHPPKDPTAHRERRARSD